MAHWRTYRGIWSPPSEAECDDFFARHLAQDYNENHVAHREALEIFRTRTRTDQCEFETVKPMCVCGTPRHEAPEFPPGSCPAPLLIRKVHHDWVGSVRPVAARLTLKTPFDEIGESYSITGEVLFETDAHAQQEFATALEVQAGAAARVGHPNQAQVRAILAIFQRDRIARLLRHTPPTLTGVRDRTNKTLDRLTALISEMESLSETGEGALMAEVVPGLRRNLLPILKLQVQNLKEFSADIGAKKARRKGRPIKVDEITRLVQLLGAFWQRAGLDRGFDDEHDYFGRLCAEVIKVQARPYVRIWDVVRSQRSRELYRGMIVDDEELVGRGRKIG